MAIEDPCGLAVDVQVLHELHEDARAELARARGLLGSLRAALFARESTRIGVAEEVDAYLGPIVAPLDALAQAAQDDGQYDPSNQN